MVTEKKTELYWSNKTSCLQRKC